MSEKFNIDFISVLWPNYGSVMEAIEEILLNFSLKNINIKQKMH